MGIEFESLIGFPRQKHHTPITAFSLLGVTCVALPRRDYNDTLNVHLKIFLDNFRIIEELTKRIEFLYIFHSLSIHVDILYNTRTFMYDDFFKSLCILFFYKNLWEKDQKNKMQNGKNQLEFYIPSTDSTQKLLQLMPIRILFLHCHELKSVHSPLGNTELSPGQRILLV